ncbi:MAG TPA: hypothetical protein VGL64_13395 [Amycolatopsis sp.]
MEIVGRREDDVMAGFARGDRERHQWEEVAVGPEGGEEQSHCPDSSGIRPAVAAERSG